MKDIASPGEIAAVLEAFEAADKEQDYSLEEVMLHNTKVIEDYFRNLEQPSTAVIDDYFQKLEQEALNRRRA